MNIIELFGHLGADVETRSLPDGTKVSTLRLATNVRKGSQDITIWYQVTLWGSQWDRIFPYLTKGKGLIIVGELQPPRTYTDKNGVQQVALDVRAEVIRFSPFGKGERQEGQQQPGQAGQAPSYAKQASSYEEPYQQQQAPASTNGFQFSEETEDDIPF